MTRLKIVGFPGAFEMSAFKGGSGPPRPSSDRLDSWKEIAVYLRRDVSTVHRWEKNENLPIHRHLHGSSSSVYAYRSELEEWLNKRSHLNNNNGKKPKQALRFPAILIWFIPILVAITLGWWFQDSLFSIRNYYCCVTLRP